MSLDEEVSKLVADIASIDQCLQCLEVVKTGNVEWCNQNFETTLRYYIKARHVSKQYSVEIPPIDFDGLSKLEILAKLSLSAMHIASLRNILFQKAGILDAELRVRAVFSEQLDDIDDDTNFLVLRPDHRLVVTDLIAKIRQEVTNAHWIDDKHRVRVLKSISRVESEILQPLSSYQRALGGLIDLGDTLGEFGSRSKPTFDRVGELIDSLKGAKKENAQISKDKDPLQIPDLRSNNSNS